MVENYGGLRQLLADNGYSPIPCKGKRPILPEWSTRAGVVGYDEANVGLLTRDAPAIDVDVDDEETSLAIHESLSSLHPEAPRRFGRGHRSLYLFARAGDAYRKIRREYARGSEKCAIEVLADGQQFIAFGTHPETRRPYSWQGGSPLTLALYELPLLSESGARETLETIEERLESLGWVRVGASRGGASMIRLPDPLRLDYSPGSEGERLALEALRSIDPVDYGSWIAAGMAIKAEGLPFELWDSWSSLAGNYDPASCRRKWETLNPRGTGLHALRAAAGLGTAELDFEPIEGWARPSRGPVSGERIQTLADIADAPAPEWLVKGIVPRKSLVGLIAAPNVGKSFLLLDLAAAVERAGEGETRWFGRRVKAGPEALVILFSYEGSAALRARALRSKYPGVGRRIVIEPGWPNLRDPASVERVIERVRQIQQGLGGRAVMVAFDTLNLALHGGNENSPEDMGAAVAGLKLIRDAISCSVVVVHHLGKDASRGARGHSSLLGALDTEITITGDPAGAVRTRTVSLTKVRDGDRTGDFAWFDLDVVRLGVDEDLDPVTSCIVRPTIEEDVDAARAESLLSRVRAALEPHPEGLPLNRLSKVVGGKTESVRTAIKGLVREGRLDAVEAARGSLLIRIPRPGTG